MSIQTHNDSPAAAGTSEAPASTQPTKPQPVIYFRAVISRPAPSAETSPRRQGGR